MPDSAVRVSPRSTRAGRYHRQPAGYEAFVPAPFPPADLDLGRLIEGIEAATLALGKLLRETTGRKSHRRFAFDRYLALFEERDQRNVT